MKFSRYFILISLCFISQWGYSQNVPFVQYNVNEGLSSSNIYRCLEDKNGFMWFCSDNGVTRYDGFYFDQFTIDDGLSDAEVLSLAEDSKGRIWFLTFGGHLSYYLDGRIYNEKDDTTLKECFVPSCFQSMFEDNQGRLWFSTHDNHLILKTDQTVQKFRFRSKQDRKSLTKWQNGILMPVPVLNKDNDNVWVIFGNEVFEFNEKLQAFEERDEVEAIFRSMFRYESKYSVYYLSEAGAVCGYSVGEERQILKLTSNLPTNIYLLEENKVVLSVDRRTEIIDVSTNRVESRLLSNNIVQYMHIDKHKNVWLCTYGAGVIKIGQFARDVRVWKNDQLDSDKVTSVFVDQSGIWTGYNNGILSLNDNGRIRHIQICENQSRVLSLIPFKNGNILAGTDSGIYLVKPDMSSELLEWDGITSKNYHIAIKDIKVSPEGTIYCATSTSLAQSIEIEDDLPKMKLICREILKRSYSVALSDPKTLWYSNLDGLNCSSIDEICETRGEVFCTDRIIDIDRIDSKTIIATTEGLGLFVIRDKSIEDTLQLYAHNGKAYINKVCYANQSLWAATSKGVFQIREIDNKWQVVERYGINEGLPILEVNDITTYNGWIYAATSAGTAILPDKIIGDDNLGQIYIRKISGTWGRILNKNEVELDYLHNNLVIDYSVVDIDQNTRLEFFYIIDGSAKKSILNSRTLALSELPYGRHEIEIYGGISGESMTDPAVVFVNVVAPFWKETWFELVIGVVILGIFVLISYLMVQRKFHHLERINAVNEERARISADLHDDIGADLTRISLMAELSAKSKDDKAIEYNRRVIEESKKLRSKTDQIVWTLTPHNDRLLNLAMYINHYGSEFLEDSGVQWQFENSIHVDSNISALKRRNLFLAIKEILNNSLKHANANLLILHIYVENGILYLNVSDNGSGFERGRDGIESRSGLKNIRNRIREIGGEVDWFSNEKSGTEVKIKVPL